MRSSNETLPLRVSIVICTRDRCCSLQRTLESICQSSVPASWQVELLVVDNGSTDSTRSTCLSLQSNQMSVRYLYEPRKGKGYAYNTAIAAAVGEILLFTDDDVLVPLNWIMGMCSPILDRTADATAGGVIFPPHLDILLSAPPLSRRRSWFASSENVDPIAPVRMIGANMAFHRRVLEKVPGFDPELGPGGLGFGDETLFSRQLLAAGYTLSSAFEISVEHHFDLDRLSNDRLIAAAQSMGRSHAFVFHHWEHQRSRAALLRLFLCKLKRFWFKILHLLIGSTRRTMVLHGLEAEKEHAFYCEYLLQRKRPPKYEFRGFKPAATVGKRSSLS